MGVIKVFVQAKEKEALEVAKKTEELYLKENLTYREALAMAKETIKKGEHKK